MAFVVRTSIFALALFFYGGPQFDDLRPAAIDPPLKNFHRQTATLVAEMANDVGSLPRNVRSFAAAMTSSAPER